MQFNSVKRGNFSGLAKSTNRAMDTVFDAARSTAVDNTAIAKESIKGRGLERRAAMKAEGQVAEAGLKAATKVKLTEIKLDAEKSVRKSKASAARMAGIVGGLGTIIGGAAMMGGDKEAKAEREELKGMRNAMDAKRDKFDAESEQRRTEYMNSYFNRDGSAKLTKIDDTSVSTEKPKQTVSSNFSAASTTKPISKSKPGRSNWGALSSIIRTVEGTTGDKGYTTRFGGQQFDDLSKHPNIAAPTPWGTKSEAAGAYQFMKPTWDEAKAALGLTDFSRESQEKAGRFLTQRRGVNPDTKFNTFEDFSAAISKLSPEWAGLPNSQKGRTGYHGQANSSMQDLWIQYQNYYN